MSADRIIECPRCRAQRIAKLAMLRKEAESSKVSDELKAKMIKALETDFDIGGKQTFSEYYEVGILGGQLLVDYSGFCDVCSYSVKFNHKGELP